VGVVERSRWYASPDSYIPARSDRIARLAKIDRGYREANAQGEAWIIHLDEGGFFSARRRTQFVVYLWLPDTIDPRSPKW